MSPRKSVKQKNSAPKKRSSITHRKLSNRNNAVDEIVATTRVRTAPKIEIRKAGTLAQALTEPAVAVVKPQTRVVERRVKRARRAA